MKAIAHLNHSIAGNYSANTNNFSFSALWNKFIAFAASQEQKRFLWAAISLVGHGTFFTIVTMATVILTGTNIFLVAATSLTMAMVLVVNLAALPTKYIVSVFFLSLLADLVIAFTALALWLN
jgi:hypothetical protein